MKPLACLALTLGLMIAAPVLAQDAPALPAACTAHAGGHEEHSMPAGSGSMRSGDATGAMTASDAGHQALMDSMKAMDGMGAALSAEDVDVAFVCGMIPHHRAAIAMAKAELAHGDDAWARKMAQEIIAAQEREIAEMTAWLEKQPQ